MFRKIFLGDIVSMRRPHPCGENRWEIVRVGMDIRLRCLACGRRVLMPRAQFERQVRGFFTSTGRGEAFLENSPDNKPPAS